MQSGYNNDAFGTDDSSGAQTSSMELERVVIAGKTVAKCCGSSKVQNHQASDIISPNTSGPDITSNVCLPKCPAVKQSPWDPIKTRFAAVLTIAIVVWFLMGVLVVKF